jgi:hypothetical protein
METKTYTHKGHLIRRDAFRFRVPSMPWGDEPGEAPAFKTLAAARAFIDRSAAGSRRDG